MTTTTTTITTMTMTTTTTTTMTTTKQQGKGDASLFARTCFHPFGVIAVLKDGSFNFQLQMFSFLHGEVIRALEGSLFLVPSTRL